MSWRVWKWTACSKSPRSSPDRITDSVISNFGNGSKKWVGIHLPRRSDFSPETNVLWRSAVPAGHSSPVIWDSHIFLTATEPANEKELIALL